MNVLITGGSGFIGAAITRACLRQGAQVTLLSRSSGLPWRLRDLTSVPALITCALHQPECVEYFQGLKMDVVIHAAWYGVHGQRKDESAQLQLNLPMTQHALEIASVTGAHTWIGLGSQAEYGLAEGIIAEDTAVRPVTAYGEAKLSACTLALQKSHIFRTVWLRLFSLYGPQEGEGWLIPSLVQALIRQEPFPMSSCTQQRDYLYVEDAAAGIMAAAMDPSLSGIYNLASGSGVRLRDIVEYVCNLIPDGDIRIGARPDRADQSQTIVADMQTFFGQTDWRPQTTLQEGLAITVEALKNRYI